MRPRALTASLLVVSAFFTTHCSVSDLLPVEGKIFFSVLETHRSYDCNCAPDITLVMKTEKIYGCLNYQIKTEIFRSGGQIDLKISGIEPPEGYCLTAMGPATARKALELPEGTYTLNLSYNYAVDRYHLIVNADSLQVVSTVPSFSQPEFSVYWRYPKNSFVYLCGTMTETSWICDDFLSRLLKDVNLEEFTFPDYGEIPYPRSSEGHYYDAPARYFRYQSEADFDMAGEILKTYSKDVISQYEGVSLWLQNWKNKTFRSWLFEDP
jgi:hypothetical protein